MVKYDGIKLIALDLDGTLLNPGGTISSDTIAQLRRLAENYIYISIATGRPYQAALDLIISNGITPADGFPHVFMCEERDIYMLRDGRYEALERNHAAFESELSYLPLARDIVTSIDEENTDTAFYISNRFLQEQRGFMNIFCLSPDDSFSIYIRLKELTENTGLKPVRNRTNVALRSVSVGKGSTLERTVEMLDILPEDVLAVGDSHNDWDMLDNRLKTATTQNADEEIKELVLSKGGIISKSGFSDGVAEILKLIP